MGHARRAARRRSRARAARTRASTSSGSNATSPWRAGMQEEVREVVVRVADHAARPRSGAAATHRPAPRARAARPGSSTPSWARWPRHAPRCAEALLERDAGRSAAPRPRGSAPRACPRRAARAGTPQEARDHAVDRLLRHLHHGHPLRHQAARREVGERVAVVLARVQPVDALVQRRRRLARDQVVAPVGERRGSCGRRRG